MESVVYPVVKSICKKKSLDFELFTKRVNYTSVKQACEFMEYYLFFVNNYYIIYSLLKENLKFDILNFIINNKILRLEDFINTIGSDRLNTFILEENVDYKKYSMIPFNLRVRNVDSEIIDYYGKDVVLYEF